MNPYRQGDISLHPIEKLPANIKKLEQKGFFVLAYGEATGHKHLLEEKEAGSFEIYQDEQGRYILEIKKPVLLSHPEHKTLTIEKGIYIQKNEREYDYWEMATRRIVD